MERFHAEEGGSGEAELVSFFEGKHEFLYDTPSNSMLEVLPLIADNGVSKRQCFGNPGRFLPKMVGSPPTSDFGTQRSDSYDMFEQEQQSDDPVVSKDALIEEGWPESLDSLSVITLETERDLSAASEPTPKISPETQPVTPFKALRSLVRSGRSRDGPKAAKSRTQEPAPQSRDECAETELSAPNRSFAAERIEELEKEINAATERQSAGEESDQGSIIEHRAGVSTLSPPHHFLPTRSVDEIPILSRKSQLEASQTAVQPPSPTTAGPTTTPQGFVPVASAGRAFLPVAATGVAASAVLTKVTKPGTVQRFQPLEVPCRSQSNSTESLMDVSQLYPGQELGKQQVKELSKTQHERRRVTRKEQVLAQRTAEKAASPSKAQRLQGSFGLTSNKNHATRKPTEKKKSKVAKQNHGKVPQLNLLTRLRRERSNDRELPEDSQWPVIATFPIASSKKSSSKKEAKAAVSKEDSKEDVDPFVILGITKPPLQTEPRPTFRQRTRSLTGVFKKTGTLEQKPTGSSLGSATLVMTNTSAATFSTRTTSAHSSQKASSRSVFSLGSEQKCKQSTASAESKTTATKSVFSLRSESGKPSSRNSTSRTTSSEGQKSRLKSAFALRSASGTAAAAATNAAASSKEPATGKVRSWRRMRSLDSIFKKNRKTSGNGNSAPAATSTLDRNDSETSSIWRMVGEDDNSLQTKGSLRCRRQQREEPEVGVIESFIESLFDYALDDWDSESSEYSSDNEASFSSGSQQGRFLRAFREESKPPPPANPLSSISEMVTGAFGGSWLYGDSPATTKKKVSLMG